jgi:hypothetical protein
MANILDITLTEIKKTNLAEILPFTQTSALEQTKKCIEKGEVMATELFSFFTANIIKEEVIFTR